MAGALAEVGTRSAALTLCRNEGAELAASAAQRLIERFGDDGEVRFALSQRSDIGSPIRHALVVATARALSEFATRCEWMSPERARRVTGEARDRATISIAADYESEDASGQRRFAAYLRASGHLTPALILRALLSGNVSLFEAALCELTGKASVRVAGLVRNPTGLGFAALFKSAGLPPSLLPAFRAALEAVRDARGDFEGTGAVRLHRRVVERVIRACADTQDSDLTRVTALLRRFEAEAARDEARARLEARDETDRHIDAVWGRPESHGRLRLGVAAAA